MRITYKSKYPRISLITDRLLNRIYINFPSSPLSYHYLTPPPLSPSPSPYYYLPPNLAVASLSYPAVASLRSRYNYINPSLVTKKTKGESQPRRVRARGPILKAESKTKSFTPTRKRSKNRFIAAINIDERESQE